MGGHDHGHHEPYKVPKASIYDNKAHTIRELKMLQDELAKVGLKDPWIRNEVWRYNYKIWGNPRLRIFKFFFHGLPLGAACAAATIAYEEYYGVYDHNHGDHGDHGHGEHKSH